jgi:Cu(I)/Ag(I) efflux system membrane fusion protein
MRKLIMTGAAFVAVLTGAAGVYRLGTGHWPQWSHEHVTAGKAERLALYWKHPGGEPDFSPAPKKASDGRDYVPVYDEEAPDFAGNKPKPVPQGKNGPRKILYYRNPMGLADTSPQPKKDSMGMDYIPVYEGEDDDGASVKISPGKVQRSGVRTEAVRLRTLIRPVRAPGAAKADERMLRVVTLRADGFIEALYVNETGMHVKAGDPLFRVYSPQMVSAQIDYRTAMTSPGTAARNEAGALQRLRNLDIPATVLEHLRGQSEPAMSIDWPSPVTGFVLEKKVINGQMVKAGDEIYRIADLSTIWVIADVSEQDFDLIKEGAPVKLTFRAFSGETFDGRVTFVLHELNAATRTGQVRIEVKNPGHRIKHEMFADVEIDAGAGEAERLSVPVSAVIDSGNRQVALVDRGEGRFEPRAVKLGVRGGDYVEVKDGLKAGDKVVVTANFLIDAESNLKAALAAFTADQQPAAEAKP